MPVRSGTVLTESARPFSALPVLFTSMWAQWRARSPLSSRAHAVKDLPQSLAGEKLQKYDAAIERNVLPQFSTSGSFIFLNLMTIGGALPSALEDYFFEPRWESVATFIFTFLIGTLKDVWASGDWGRLISSRVFIAVALFVLSLFIPKAVKKIRGEV